MAQEADRTEPKYPWKKAWWFRLLAILFLAEIFTPFLQWPIGLPKLVMVGVEGAAAFIIFYTVAYMLKQDRIPKGILVILGITLIWGIVAVFEGQSAAAFLWGWWRLFKYPLIGIFTYLVIGNPKDFAEWFIKFCIGLLAFQVAVQAVMFAMGYPMGDDLAGTMGWRGVMQFTMMVFFVVCMGIGHWLSTGELKYLLISLVLGLIGTTFSATKFYLFAVSALLIVTFAINLVRGGRIRVLVVYSFLAILVFAVFLPIFNRYIVAIGDQPLQAYLEPEALTRYLLYTRSSDGSFYVARGYAPIYSWQQIQRDETATLFGFGLGSRSQSSVLGVTGVGLVGDIFGGAPGSTLATWMQEYGIIGIVLFLLLITWINTQIFRYIRKKPDPNQSAMAYGLALFTSFWPVWIFYHNVWTAGVMLTLYWVSVGYIFHQSFYRPRRSNRAAAHPIRKG